MTGERQSNQHRNATCFLAVLLVVGLTLPAIITWLYFVTFAGKSVMGLVYGIGKAMQFSLPLLWFLGPGRAEVNRSLLRPTGILAGGLFGLAVAAGMWGLYVAIRGAGMFDGVREQAMVRLSALGLDSQGGFVVVAVFYSVIHSFLEEYYWRWFIYGELRKFLGVPLAVVVASLGFASHHVIVLAMYFDRLWFVGFCSAGVAVGGAVWSVLYERSRSLVGIWVSHLLVDAAIMSIGWDVLFGTA